MLAGADAFFTYFSYYARKRSIHRAGNGGGKPPFLTCSAARGQTFQTCPFPVLWLIKLEEAISFSPAGGSGSRIAENSFFQKSVGAQLRTRGGSSARQSGSGLSVRSGEIKDLL